MKRLHLFEFEDWSVFPALWRNLVTEYLQFMVTRFHLYRPVVPKLRKALNQMGCQEILDIGSGACGPILEIKDELERDFQFVVGVTLTDKYPHRELKKRMARLRDRGVRYLDTPVDALRIPAELKGFRTFFTSFHHFRPEQARHILKDCIQANTGVAVFELTGRDLLTMLLILLSPLYVWLVTPFIKPRSWYRFLFTYLIPVVPFVAFWDGVVSNLRTYSPGELSRIVGSLGASHYRWETGKLASFPGTKVTYLIGYPTKAPPATQ